MRLVDILWLPTIIDKLATKHQVYPYEVEELLRNEPHFRKVQKGNIPGEDLYSALGVTGDGRYLVVFFIYKMAGLALVVTARDMDRRERRLYERRK